MSERAESGRPHEVGDYVVTELEALDRGNAAGYNRKETGRYVQLFPRISKADYYDLLVARSAEVRGEMESLLGRFPRINERARQDLVATKKIVAIDKPGRGRVLEVVPRVEKALDAAEFPPEEAVGKVELSELEKREIRKTYDLVQIFNDRSVLDKYSVTAKQLNTASRTMVSQPAAAARFLEDVINSSQQDVYVRVRAGKHERSKARARLTIKALCRDYEVDSAVIRSDIIGPNLYVYGDDTTDGWHVCGPLEYAWEVTNVRKLLLHADFADVDLLLGMELVLLKINISDGHSYAARTLKYHVGTAGSVQELPRAVSPVVAEMLSVDQRAGFALLSRRLEEVTDSEGRAVATAVRVTDKHVLVNSHVIDSVPDALCGGRRVAVHKALSRDVVSVVLPGGCEPWVLRAPEVGERAVVLFLCDGKEASSSPVSIVSVVGETVVFSKAPDVKAGMSGGALVALSDFALLGVHSAETNKNLLACGFGPDVFRDLVESDETSNVSRVSEEGSFGAEALARFKKKGLGHVVASCISSIVPVFVSGNHVGMAVNVKGKLYTTCDAELPLRVGLDKVPVVWSRVDGRGCLQAASPFPLKTPEYKRGPSYYERVMVVGVDQNDPYMSVETSVLHIGTSSTSFVLDDIDGVDKPLTGGVVLGSDGAVLGICGSRSLSTAVGLGYQCWTLPEERTPSFVDDPVVFLSRKFPFLNVETWEQPVVEEVFTHSSVGEYRSGRRFNAGMKPLALVGDCAAKGALYEIFRAAAIPHPTWNSRFNLLQSNARLAEVAWEFGFAALMRVGRGVDVPPGGKAYADLTEALVGAVALYETKETLVKMLGVLGMIPDVEGTGSDAAEYFGDDLRFSVSNDFSKFDRSAE